MKRLAAAIAVAIASLAAAGAASAATLGNWDRSQQRAVAHAGVLRPIKGAGFAGQQPLTAGQLRAALAALAPRVRSAGAIAVPDGAVTIAGFDALVVRELGLVDLAQAVQSEAARAGLAPPSRFGTEVVARQLGLRYDHPSGDDALELYPTDPITRAEAAWSFAQILGSGARETSYARQVLGRFRLPAYTPAQRTALTLAVSKIGMPYIWGGESDTRSSLFGYQAHGGYDCSGFVWRVFKLSGNPAGRRIGGRTADAMAREIPRSRRIPFGRIRPADLLFFGSPRYVGHVGIALSRDFMIHSSGQGVYVAPLWESWRRGEFVWGRRVLR
jgi:cell wall-associated NlpC family hydrolase